MLSSRKNSSATVAQHLGANRLCATLAPDVGLEGLSTPVSFPESRCSMRFEDLSAPASFFECRADARREVLSIPAGLSEQRPNARLEILLERTRFCEDRLPNAGLEVLSEYRFPSDGLEGKSVWSICPQNRSNVIESQSISTSLSDNKSRTVGLQNPAVEVDRRPAVESVAMSKDVKSLTATDDPSRPVSASFLTSIAAKVNAFWQAFHSNPQ